MNKNEVIEYLVTKVHDQDEPLFLLRGRDPVAENIVDRWADMVSLMGTPPSKWQGARKVAEDMRNYHTKKLPD